MSVNVLLNVMGYASPFPKQDQEIEIEFDPEAPAEVNPEPVPQAGQWQQQQDAPVAAVGCASGLWMLIKLWWDYLASS